MTEQEAILETLSLAVAQLRRAANLLNSSDDDARQEASDLLRTASNTLSTAIWMQKRGAA